MRRAVPDIQWSVVHADNRLTRWLSYAWAICIDTSNGKCNLHHPSAVEPLSRFSLHAKIRQWQN